MRTAGNWYFHGWPGNSQMNPYLTIESDNGDNVAELNNEDFPRETVLANARMLGAATRMYTALEMMLEKFQHDVQPGESGWDAIRAARHALYMATEGDIDATGA